MKIVLASQSPRRKEILNSLNIEFETVVSDCDEVSNKIKAEDIVMDLATQKAKNVASRISDAHIIIAADTIVYLDGQILGKPKDNNEAFEMLLQLQDNWHTVYTGVCVIKLGNIVCYYEKSKVHMRSVCKEEILEYIRSGSPLDKAGAYGVQDANCNFVDKVEGELETVIGLPIKRLKKLLA